MSLHNIFLLFWQLFKVLKCLIKWAPTIVMVIFIRGFFFVDARLIFCLGWKKKDLSLRISGKLKEAKRLVSYRLFALTSIIHSSFRPQGAFYI